MELQVLREKLGPLLSSKIKAQFITVKNHFYEWGNKQVKILAGAVQATQLLNRM